MIYFDYTKQPGHSLKNKFLNLPICKCPPKISLITPFFNAAEHFDQTFCCIENQTFPWFEWIIVDDGSTEPDATFCLEQAASADKRIQLYHIPNGGPAQARNFGARQARAPYLAFLDADDLAEPTFLEYLYLALEAHPQANWAYGDMVTFGAREFLWQREFSSERMKTENLLPIMAMIRTKDFWDVNGFDVMGRYYNEDWHLWLKLLAKRKIPVHVRELLTWYRNEEHGAMAALNKDPAQVQRNLEKIEEVAAEVPNDLLAITHNGERSDFFTDIPIWEIGEALPYKSSKIRILLLLPHMVLGGADKFNLDMLEGLNPEKYEVTIATSLPEENDWQQRFATLVDDIFVMPSFLDQREWPAFLDYLIRTRQIDIVFITNSYFSYFVVPWLHIRYPEVAFVDYIHAEEKYRNGGYTRPSGKLGAFLDRTYVCNDHTKHFMEQYFQRDPASIKTVYIGVDEKIFDPSAVLPPSSFPAEESRPVVLFPCRIYSQKRPFLMLQIAQRLPHYCFVIVGDGPQIGEVRNTVQTQNIENVFFAGRQADMRPWYKLASVTLICSSREGLALTAYESLAMGTPVVSADVGGQKELISSEVGLVVPFLQKEPDDQDVRVFSEEEIQNYVGAIKKIVESSDYGKICLNCRIQILKKFTLEKMRSIMRTEMNSLATSFAKKERRERIAAFSALQPLFESYLDLYGTAESAEILRPEVTHLRNLWETQGCPAVTELERIHQMRSFRLVNKYQKIMELHFFRKIRSFFKIR